MGWCLRSSKILKSRSKLFGMTPDGMDYLDQIMQLKQYLSTMGRKMRTINCENALIENGNSILIVEHNLPELLKIVDRVIVLNFGKIIAEGPPQEIISNREVIKAYTGKEEMGIVA